MKPPTVMESSDIFAVVVGRQFCVCVGLPVQMHAEQIEVGGHFVCLSRKFTSLLFKNFHVKKAVTQVPCLQHAN